MKPEDSNIISYVPIGEKESIKLSATLAEKFIINPTKSGAMPDSKTVMGFLMLCKARGLNPYLGDATITGYDTKNGPEFSIITSKAALDKRADLNPDFDGMESGVIVRNENGVERREGSIVIDGEKLIGAWASVYRKDRTRPTKHDVNLTAYDQQRARWNSDKPGMIVKCAEAGALRKAFPNSFDGLISREEMKAVVEIAEESPTTHEISSSQASTPKGIPMAFSKRDLSLARPEIPARDVILTDDAALGGGAVLGAGAALGGSNPVSRKRIERELKDSRSPANHVPERDGAMTQEPVVTQEAEIVGEEQANESASVGLPSVAHHELLGLVAHEGLFEDDLVTFYNSVMGGSAYSYMEIPEQSIIKMIDSVTGVIQEVKAL